MSLLPATSHRDPQNPFWATTGGASGISTIVAGAGITVVNPNGASTTITNSGVRTLTGGTGISIGGANAQDRIVTNSGVTSIVAGQGITISGGTGAVTITNNGSSDIAPLTTVSAQNTPGGSPVSFGTIALTKTYTYAEGYGFIQTTGGLFASPPDITVYLSSGNTAQPLDLTKAVGYILSPYVAGRVTLSGVFYDLSAIKHYDPAGFTSVTITWLDSTGGTGVVFSPVGSTMEVTSITTTTPVTTKTLTPRTGSAGFKFFTNI